MDRYQRVEMLDEDRIWRALQDEAEKAADLGSFVWDVAANQVSWSPNYYRLLGHEPGAFPATAEAFLAQVHPDDLPTVVQTLERARNEGAAPPMAHRLIRTDGAVRHMMSRAVPVRGADGRVARLVGTMQDRTHRVEGQRALEEYAHVLEQAQRVAHIGSWVWRPATGEITWSPELYRIAGVPPDYPLTVSSFDELLHPADLAHLQARRQQTLADGVPRPWEGRLVRPGGETRWIRMEARAISDDPLWLLGVIHDVTEQRRLAEQLQHGRTLQAVGRLASGVAHDFNNLLTVIMSNIQLAAMDAPSEDLEDAMLAAEAAAELTQRLLSLGGTSQLPLEPLDLDEVVYRSARLLRSALPEEVELSIDATSGAVIKGDRRQLDQLLLNLVLNGRDAVEGRGMLVIRTRIQDQCAVLEVQDDGPGMSDEACRRAAEPFFTTKGPGLGTGLGLAMVRGVVDHMGGQLRFERAPGGGTSVQVWVPLSLASQRTPSPVGAPTRRGPRLRVLVVEDEPGVRRLAERVLLGAGMEVWTAGDPEEALPLLEHPLDVVLCDVAMPKGGGRAVLEALEARQGAPPIVFMTGYARREEWLVPHPVLPKPFLPEALIDLVVRATEQAWFDATS